MNTYLRKTKLVALLLASSVVLFSCEKDDFTGHSKLKATSPTITVTAPDATELNDPDTYLFEIDLDMSEAQIADVAVHFVQTGGDAEGHTDYSLYYEDPFKAGNILDGERTIIPKGVTHVTVYLEILSEELYYGDVTLTLQIGDGRTANAKITPVEITIDKNM